VHSAGEIGVCTEVGNRTAIMNDVRSLNAVDGDTVGLHRDDRGSPLSRTSAVAETGLEIGDGDAIAATILRLIAPSTSQCRPRACSLRARKRWQRRYYSHRSG